jgi:hypothetical protein
MSRRRDFEIVFGSDSFLDVIANIVGILIILIVIAGVKVGRMPVRLATLPTPAVPSPPFINDLPETMGLVEDSEPTPLLSTIDPEELPPLVELAPSSELVARVEGLETEIADLSKNSEHLALTLQSHMRQQSELKDRVQTARACVALEQIQLNTTLEANASQKADIRLAKETLARLLAQLHTLEERTPAVESLQHHLTPVSRTVSGKEKHYRLEKNRVAEVPIEVLVTKLKEQIERRKDWLVRTRSHQGQVGPFAGFTMNYLVRVETLNGLDELRAGHGGYQISVSSWDVVPEPELRGETEQIALSQGSFFYESLIGADPDSTLTFWVYPDSFAIYRKLQTFAHEHGFPVAARPLPNGIPIAGSPKGSKSASQ